MIAAAATLLDRIHASDWVKRTGRISRFVGLTIEANGPDARVGELCEIYSRAHANGCAAEVVGFSDGRVQLMPYEELHGIEVGSEIIATGRFADVSVGEHLLGRVIDGFGMPLDGTGLQDSGTRVALYPKPINPLLRGPIEEPILTGIRAVDTLLPIGKGQRMGIFSGSGVGKSTLLRMISKRADCDVSVIALIGERGREVQALVDTGLDASAREKTIIVAATSDQPPLVRRRAAFVATAIAEYFRDEGLSVCLMMDSITRVAMAQREIGLASGELPTAKGYTPSVFSLLPRLLERGGVSESGGTLTALYTILVEGDDHTDPIADNVRAILDGHIILSRTLAQRGIYPPIDILASISRLVNELVSRERTNLIDDVTKVIASYETSRDLIEVGAYQPGTNPDIDRAIDLMPKIENFLTQDVTDERDVEEVVAELQSIMNRKVA